MSDQKFQVGDRVRWGTAEGRVVDSGDYVCVEFFHVAKNVSFYRDGSTYDNLPGQPLLELIERPKPKKKITVWRWEYWNEKDQYMGQTGALYPKAPNTDCDWKKVPGSEREIEVEE